MKNGTGVVEFIAGQGWLQSPDEVGEKNWSRALQITLVFGNIPYQFTLSQKPCQIALQALAGCSTGSRKYMSHPESFPPQNSESSQTQKSHTNQENSQGSAGRGCEDQTLNIGLRI